MHELLVFLNVHFGMLQKAILVLVRLLGTLSFCFYFWRGGRDSSDCCDPDESEVKHGAFGLIYKKQTAQGGQSDRHETRVCVCFEGALSKVG